MGTRITFEDGELSWLKGLVEKAKLEAHHANTETPHPLFQLRKENMVALEKKLNEAIQRKGKGGKVIER